ncbi:CGNR zinc finger domain-containing protein [Achromobacter xylosoxidans]|uniref:CGNR zinc finger domain-containing protein n=1 Tax=Alcaligenes xylosoxydans xylosoxydans TaxID=85698 RepID=UPI003BEEE819
METGPPYGVRPDSDASVVNHVLKAGGAATELAWDGASQSFKAVRPRRLDDAAGMLEPVARAIVELLTDTPLALVRQCEAHDCTLMFHDRTKSHRRRWCSMALCGNRMKVAAFRSRKKESESD